MIGARTRRERARSADLRRRPATSAAAAASPQLRPRPQLLPRRLPTDDLPAACLTTPPLRALPCQARCDAEPLCGGFTSSYGVCQLRASVGCAGELGSVPPDRPTPSQLLGGRYTTVAGLNGCAAASAAPVPASWFDQCSSARCAREGADLSDAGMPSSTIEREMAPSRR